MRKAKEQKGITLIALIITIIVLLILAVVAIGAVQNDGIINYAKNARDEYGAAQKKENEILGNYLEKLNENDGKEKIITFTIDGITYSAEEGMSWRQWLESKYYSGTHGDEVLYIGDNNHIITKEDKYNTLDKNLRNGANEDYVYSSDIIVNGRAYRMIYWGDFPPDEF